MFHLPPQAESAAEIQTRKDRFIEEQVMKVAPHESDSDASVTALVEALE